MAITDQQDIALSDLELVVARRWAHVVASLIEEDNADILTILSCIADMTVCDS